MDQQRDERFIALYESSRARLLAYAIRRTFSSEDAADVIAETFAIAWRRLDDIPDGEEALLWLYATAWRVVANHSRKTRRRTQLVQRLGAHILTGLQSPAQSGEIDALDARRALEQLSDEDRELLLLVGWDGLDSAGLAFVLGCSPTAARIRLFHARSRLKSVLADRSTWAEQPVGIEQSRTTSGLMTEAPEEV